MIPERISQLLTAYVDGQLSRRQRRAVECLVRRSPEARQLLQQLRQDADRLRQLPKLTLNGDLAPRIQKAIVARGLKVPAAPLPAPPTIPAWMSLSAAAAILLAVGLASYTYFAAFHGGQHSLTVATQDQNHFSAQPRHTIANQQAVVRPDAPPAPQDPDDPATPPTEVVNKSDPPKPPESVPDLNDSDPPSDVLATPRLLDPRMEPFEIVKPRLTFVALRELDQEPTVQRLMAELEKESAFRLELFCMDGAKSLDRLQAVFQAQGIRLLIDQDAQARMNQRLKTNYVLFAEDVLPTELTAILQQLGNDDKNIAAQNPREGQFGQMLVNPLSTTDRERLAHLLGISPAQVSPIRLKAPPGVDLRQPISEGTVRQIVDALSGDGQVRPGMNPASEKKSAERLALVFSYNPVRPRPAVSKEVQQFLNQRREVRAGSLQILMVVRGIDE